MKSLLLSRTFWLGILSMIIAGVSMSTNLLPENVIAIVLAVAGAGTVALRAQDKYNEGE